MPESGVGVDTASLAGSVCASLKSRRFLSCQQGPVQESTRYGFDEHVKLERLAPGNQSWLALSILRDALMDATKKC